MHRLSALWLVDHLNLRDMVRHVAELSISDKDAKVRTRASKLIEHFIDTYSDVEDEDQVDLDHPQVKQPGVKS